MGRVVPGILDGKRGDKVPAGKLGSMQSGPLEGTVGLHSGFCSWGHRGGASVLWLQPRGEVAPLVPSPPHSSLGPTSASASEEDRPADRGPLCTWSQSSQQAQRTTGCRRWLERRRPRRVGRDTAGAQVCFQTGSRSLCVC